MERPHWLFTQQTQSTSCITFDGGRCRALLRTCTNITGRTVLADQGSLRVPRPFGSKPGTLDTEQLQGAGAHYLARVFKYLWPMSAIALPAGDCSLGQPRLITHSGA